MANHDHTNHRERVRKRLAAEGLDHFAPHEVLEYLLFFCIPQGNVNPLAHRLINHFGSVGAVLQASEEELCSISGIGKHTAGFFAALRELSDEYLVESHKRIKPAYRLGELIRASKSDPLPKKMHLIILFLDGQGNLLGQARFKWAVPFPHSRELAIEAISHHTFSALLIFEKNDSMYEMDEVTWNEVYPLLRLLATIEIRVMDIYVLTPEKSVSMREKGLLIEASRRPTHYGDPNQVTDALTDFLNGNNEKDE